MAHIVPVIRAGALFPVFRWLAQRSRPLEGALRRASLGEHVATDRDLPVPVHNAVEFMRAVGRTERADFPCQAASQVDLGEIGALGALARARPTPRQALHAVAAFMSRHSTHERFTVRNTPGGVRVIDSWSIPLDAEALHIVEQYVAALIHALCAATGAAEPLLERVETPPHPTAGVEHLRPWFGRVEAAAGPRLVVDIAARVADAPFVVGSDGGLAIPANWRALRDEGDFVRSLRWTIAAMLGPGAVSIDAVAAAAGVAPRTLQRRLAGENLSFSDLLDQTRREAALDLLTRSDLSVAEAAARLGYANASALTRAVRRWTGETPRKLRAGREASGRSQIVAPDARGVKR